MGNSNGNLHKYWDLFRSNPRCQGGFVWDWVDQGLRKAIPAPDVPAGAGAGVAAKVETWGYGGDFMEPVNDGNFCVNGVVWPDRTPHPAMEEVRAAVLHCDSFRISARGSSWRELCFDIVGRRIFYELCRLVARCRSCSELRTAGWLLRLLRATCIVRRRCQCAERVAVYPLYEGPSDEGSWSAQVQATHRTLPNNRCFALAACSLLGLIVSVFSRWCCARCFPPRLFLGSTLPVLAPTSHTTAPLFFRWPPVGVAVLVASSSTSCSRSTFRLRREESKLAAASAAASPTA